MAKATNKTKATAAGVGVGLAGAVAGWASAKYCVPLEITGPVVGGVLGYLARWAAKLDPAK